jgi:hypothetical protein
MQEVSLGLVGLRSRTKISAYLVSSLSQHIFISGSRNNGNTHLRGGHCLFCFPQQATSHLVVSQLIRGG